MKNSPLADYIGQGRRIEQTAQRVYEYITSSLTLSESFGGFIRNCQMAKKNIITHCWNLAAIDTGLTPLACNGQLHSLQYNSNSIVYNTKRVVGQTEQKAS